MLKRHGARLTRAEREEVASYGRPTVARRADSLNPAQSGLLSMQASVGNAAVADAVGARVDRAEVPYDQTKPLRWEHFKGKVPKKTGSMSAGTYSAWSPTWAKGAFGYSWTKLPGKGYEVTAKADPSGMDIRSYVDTKKSWVKADEKTPELLGHERGHLAITHVIGEKTEVTVRNAAGTATKQAKKKKAAIKAAMKAVQGPVFAAYEHGWKVARLAQKRYDGKSAVGTDHGRRPKQQADWATAVGANLPKYPVPFPGVDAKLAAEG